MTRQTINKGTVANDQTGDTLRTAADKINNNFSEIYNYFGGGASISLLPANRTTLGGIIVGSSLSVAANGLISSNIATTTQRGVVFVGSTMQVAANGQIDVDVPNNILDLGIQDGSSGQVLKTLGNGTFIFANVAATEPYGNVVAVGNPFDQNLNTFNQVAFTDVTASRFVLDPAATGIPTVNSSTSIYLTANNASNGVVAVTNTPFKLCSFTQTQRTTLAPQNGYLIYNSSNNKIQAYAGGVWVDLH
jgi:hypothetical protein